MTTIDPALREMLRASLDDHFLSRAEKREIRGSMTDFGLDDNQRRLLRHQAFELARERAGEMDVSEMLKWLEGIVSATRAVDDASSTVAKPEVVFGPGDHCWRRIAHYLDASHKGIDLCVFTITDDRLTKRLMDAHDRGVRLRLISDNDKAFDLGSDLERLRGHGIDVRTDRSEHHMHHKFAIFDDRILLSGSYNWTRSAAHSNRENFLVTTDPELCAPYRRAFADLWNELG